MTYYGQEEHEPVTYWRGYPLFAAHLIVAGFVASMLITTILSFMQMGQIAGWLIFTSEQALGGQVWRLFTYGFWNRPSLGFALDMVMLVWFGREVEKFVGRRRFLLLFAGIYLVTPVLFTLIGRWLPTTLLGQAGSLAVFVAFATLFPNLPLLFAITARWAAVILVGLYSLMALSDRNWQMLLSLWATTGFAFGFIRHHQGHFELPKFKLRRRAPKLKVVPDVPVAARKAKPAATGPSDAPASMAEVDALLDKIAQSGIHSLTAQERAKLDAARRDLKKRSGAS